MDSDAASFSSDRSGCNSTGISRTRQQFAAIELAVVLSHFDIGAIESIKEFPRGSRRAPKLAIRTEKGAFLLKRRARGKDDPYKVAFAHELQNYLAARRFPLPHLVGTTKDNNSMFQNKGRIYELFEYIPGTSFDGTPDATGDAGKTLGLFHKLATGFDPEYEEPRGTYHDSEAVRSALDQVPTILAQADSSTAADNKQKIAEIIGFLIESYDEAVEQVNDSGLPSWPMKIGHNDWHPGNMIFRSSRVVAVIDYDASRLQPRVLDMANGVLQFSIVGRGDDPDQWPDHIDVARFKRFVRGYDSIPGGMLSRAELRTIPDLMTEALIAEAAIPIAATGKFARLNGFKFLAMVERKIQWIQDHSNELVNALDQ